nr:S8 family serine peptidase [Leucobacter exalbidus]
MAWVAPAHLDELAATAGVTSVIPALAPIHASGHRSRPARPLTATPDAPAPEALAPEVPTSDAPTAASTTSCAPVPIEADGPLDSAEARARFGVDGTGVTIGVISDSFHSTEYPTSWDDDVAAGALPGPGNPCGRTTPVTVVAHTRTATDEGRAMAQLVHGVAPGATLLFADSGNTEFEMADHIRKLAEAGADIIVDDITYLTEAYYQRGFISQAIEQVQADYGVLYLTSAGNSNGVGDRGASTGVPVSSWQTAHYREMPCPAWVTQGATGAALPAGSDCLDFDPDPAGQQAYDVLQLKGHSGTVDVLPVASIGEPVGGLTTSYELHLYESCTTQPRLIRAIPSLGGELASGQLLYPGLAGAATLDLGSEVCLVIVRTAFEAGSHPAVFLEFLRGGDAIAERQFLGDRRPGDAATDRVGATVFGHAGDGSALGVAATDWQDPAYMASYSAVGPGTLLFDTVDVDTFDAAPRLPMPLQVSSPSITAVDGVRTTFYGENDGEDYRFYGTSAAAPLAAAVAALGKEFAPGLTGQELGDALASTARGTAAGGPENPYAEAGFADEFVLGAGLVSATRLIESFTDPVEAPTAPTGLRLAAVTDASLAFSWGQVAHAAGLTVELYDGEIAEDNQLEAVGLDVTATSYRAEGLDPNHEYSLLVTAVGETGDAATAQLAVYTLATAPSDLAVDHTGERALSVSWREDSAPDHYLVRVVPVVAGAITNSDDAPPVPEAEAAGCIVPVELESGSTRFTCNGLIADTPYAITVEAINDADQASSATVQARTTSATQAPHSGAHPDALPNATPGETPLAVSGGASLTRWYLGGAGLLVLGAGVIVFARRRARKNTPDEPASGDATSAKPGSNSR